METEQCILKVPFLQMQAENVIALDFFKKGMHLNSFNIALVLLQFLNDHKHPINICIQRRWPFPVLVGRFSSRY